ncbi:unnamed protein product [Ixodes pacificus]
MMKGNKYVLEAELLLHSKHADYNSSEEDYMLAKCTMQSTIGPNTRFAVIFVFLTQNKGYHQSINVCTAPTLVAQQNAKTTIVKFERTISCTGRQRCTILCDGCMKCNRIFYNSN